MVARQEHWQLSSEAFSRLLGALDPDVEAAGARYEELRRTLVRFFEWRGAWEPETLADETLDRVARRIEGGEAVRDVSGYARGVARLLLLEDQKRARRRPVELLERHAATPAPVDDTPDAVPCLERCLDALQDGSRRLIVRYYQDSGGSSLKSRRQLAAEVGIPPGALRSRAQRIRDRLESCVRACLNAQGGAPAARRHETGK